MKLTIGNSVSFRFLCMICLLGFSSASAQIIFLEDFQNSAGFNSFTLVNQDGRAPASGVSYVNNAWVRRADLDDNTDTIAVSTSWYDPAGAADDWMITPLIHIDSQSILSWRAKAQDPDFPDGYQVRISTTDTALASFLSNFALFNVNAEQPDWVTRTVDLAAAGYANQDVYIAFRNISNDQFLLKVDDIMIRNPFSTDAQAVSVQVPQTGCQLSNAEQISITIENYGGSPLTNFDVTYIVDDGDTTITVTETVSANVAAGADYTYTFTQTADLSVPGSVYNISAYVYAPGDGDFTNDSLDAATVINVEPTDLTAPYTTSYETVGEILGWSVEDGNSDGVSWFPASGDANTGDIFFVYQYNQDAITPGDDWLFSTCLNYTTGINYELRFFYKVGNAGGTVYPEKLKVAIGTSPDAASMTTVLEDLDTVSNDFYEEKSILFTVPANGTYYIGFHCYSDPDAFILAIDDVTVGEKQPPVAGFNTSTSDLQVTFASTSTDADSLYWDFDDGTNSSGDPVIHTFPAAGTYYVCLTAFNEAGQDTYCDSITVTVDTVIGVSLIDETEFSVFPNPTQGALVAQMNKPVVGKSTLVVNDMVGKEILSVPVESERMTFDLSGKPEGIYFITLQAGDRQLRRKIALTH